MLWPQPPPSQLPARRSLSSKEFSFSSIRYFLYVVCVRECARVCECVCVCAGHPSSPGWLCSMNHFSVTLLVHTYNGVVPHGFILV